jgi:hypothetical protein
MSRSRSDDVRRWSRLAMSAVTIGEGIAFFLAYQLLH